MNWSGIFDYFRFWGRSFEKNGIQSTNRWKGSGTNNHPRNHNSKKSAKNIKRNRAGRKSRKKNRK